MKVTGWGQWIWVGLLAAVPGAFPLSGARAQSNEPAAAFTAFAINMSNVGPTGAGQVDIVINRWSSEAERERLLKIVREKGPDKLLDALQDTRPVGYIRSPNSIGWDLRFAARMPDEEGGARIIIVTDRPIGFYEATNRPRSIDYPFTVIEVHIDKNGQGEGRASIATKILVNKRTNMIELENYANQPVMLKNVTKRSS
jgi:hypothetical protein